MSGIMHIVRGEATPETVTLCVFGALLLFGISGVTLFISAFFWNGFVKRIKKDRFSAFIMLLTTIFGSFVFLITPIVINKYGNDKYAYTHAYLPVKDRLTKINGKEWADVREENVTITTVRTIGMGNMLGLPFAYYTVTFDDGRKVVQCVQYQWDWTSGGFRPMSDAPRVGDHWRRLYGKSFDSVTYSIGEKEVVVLFERVVQ